MRDKKGWQYAIIFLLSAVLFLTNQNASLVSLYRQLSILGFLGLGMLLELLCGDLDLSFAAQISAGTAVLALLLNQGCSLLVSCLIMAVLLIGIGLLKGFAVAKLNISPIIITMAFQLIIKGLSALLIGDHYIVLAKYISINRSKLWAWIMVLLIACIILIQLFLKNTYLGRYCCLIGENKSIMSENGIDTMPVILLVHVIASVLFSITSLLLLLITSSGGYSIGDNYLFEGIVLCCIGGIGLQGGYGDAFGVTIGMLSVVLVRQMLTRFGQLNRYEFVLQGAAILLSLLIHWLQKKNNTEPKILTVQPNKPP